MGCSGRSVENQQQVNHTQDEQEAPNEEDISLSALEVLGMKKEEGAVGAVMHMPTEEQVSEVQEKLSINSYKEGDVGEELFILPYEIGSTVTIYDVKYTNEEFVRENALASFNLSSEQDIIYVKLLIPCGIPNREIVITQVDGTEGSYIITEDGKGDRPQIQLVSKEGDK